MADALTASGGAAAAKDAHPLGAAAVAKAAHAGDAATAVEDAHPLGAAAVAEARAWLGTPYVHQASTKGAGCDCLGLLRGVWRALHGGREPAPVPAYTPDWSEAAREERLWRALSAHLAPRPLSAPARPGDVLLFRVRAQSVAKHVGLAAEPEGTARPPTFIHAYTRHGVIESPLSEPWRRRIVARFSLPEGGIC